MKITFVFAALVVGLGLSGCQNPEKALATATETGTEEALMQFLEKYGDSPQAVQAKLLLEEVAYFNAVNADSEEALMQFLEKYGDSPQAQEAKLQLEALAYSNTLDKGSSIGFLDFAERFPESRRVRVIRGDLIGFAYLEFGSGGTLNDARFRFYVCAEPLDEFCIKLSWDDASTIGAHPTAVIRTPTSVSRSYSTEAAFRYTSTTLILIREDPNNDFVLAHFEPNNVEAIDKDRSWSKNAPKLERTFLARSDSGLPLILKR